MAQLGTRTLGIARVRPMKARAKDAIGCNSEIVDVFFRIRTLVRGARVDRPSGDHLARTAPQVLDNQGSCRSIGTGAGYSPRIRVCAPALADRLTLVPDDEHEASAAAGGRCAAGACGNERDQQSGGTVFTHANLRMTWATLRTHRERVRSQVIVLMERSFRKMHGRRRATKINGFSATQHRRRR
ncbi:conserved protein of unknown function (plasmid) [Thiomonas sp. Bio17B3]|uniref:Uncharacterized protein n=1 Tax=Thiomonas arsenitoxydans (strain DSM 22701 / CIP 110005 / 3As) TaxID=426114 RepID=D6CMF2_THIA3|nr:hypothetical protein THI_3130 [Thiomonas arsenitoxydans]VDY09883.1 conserved protein of unknown function [Thiomonas sp. Sup16B3]VDY11336.1 conserved protein of unknown function [Thiomonas sp. Bio17B3]VDY15096.1 hypothetical protein TOC7_31526 [Thiomonas sp. OC7]CQR39306.1 conserved hypothetical protein [Thiomonas arsenitoxydans]